MIDGTEGFGRIGIVTLLGNSDFMPGILWEKRGSGSGSGRLEMNGIQKLRSAR